MLPAVWTLPSSFSLKLWSLTFLCTIPVLGQVIHFQCQTWMSISSKTGLWFAISSLAPLPCSNTENVHFYVNEILTIRVEAVAACGFGSKDWLKVYLESSCWLLRRSLRRRVSFIRDEREDSCSQSDTWGEINLKTDHCLDFWFLHCCVKCSVHLSVTRESLQYSTSE